MNTILFSLALLAVTAAPATVHLRGDAFSPATTTIHAGDTVTFVNDDDDAHTVTAVDGTFDSKGLDTHDSWSHTFPKAGTYKIFCELHPFMKATIIVKGSK
jgi:plastocyanin